METKEKEAYDLIKKADVKLKPGFLGGLFSSKSSRLEDSLDYLEKAANIFKLIKKWDDAGKTMERCGDIETELEQDAANYYLQAAHCYSFTDKEKSIANQRKALDIYIKKGKFQQAGKIEKELAEKFEEEQDLERAAESYKRSAEYFSMESLNSKSYEQSSKLKYADIISILNNDKINHLEAAEVRFTIKNNFRYTKKSDFSISMSLCSNRQLKIYFSNPYAYIWHITQALQ